MNTCRFCKQWTSDDLLKYGTRHYAHWSCYIKAGKSLSDLRDWQIVTVPYRLVVDTPNEAIVQAAWARHSKERNQEGARRP